MSGPRLDSASQSMRKLVGRGARPGRGTGKPANRGTSSPGSAGRSDSPATVPGPIVSSDPDPGCGSVDPGAGGGGVSSDPSPSGSSRSVPESLLLRPSPSDPRRARSPAGTGHEAEVSRITLRCSGARVGTPQAAAISALHPGWSGSGTSAAGPYQRASARLRFDS